MMTHFYRVHPDLAREVVNLENIYHGPGGSACFLAGGSPALTPDVAGVAETIGIPVFGMNKVCEQVWCDFLNVVDEAWRFNPGPFLSAKCMSSRRSAAGTIWCPARPASCANARRNSSTTSSLPSSTTTSCTTMAKSRGGTT